MATFGANLKREREMRGVPLEEIAAATKISVRSLEALEAEEYSKLPGGIFTRSFIRAYAKYLGLDEETVMAEFQSLDPPREEVNLSRLSTSNSKSSPDRSRAPLFGILIALLVLGAGYASFRYSRHITATRGVDATSRGLSAAPTLGNDQLTPSNSATNSPGDTSPPNAAGTQTGHAESGLTLQVAATEQVWVAVDVDGKTEMQRVLKPNDIQSFKARNFFDVIAGNAEGVILTLNGETLKPLGRRGEIKKVHLTRDDLKNLAP